MGWAAWLLVKIEREPQLDLNALSRKHTVEQSILQNGVDQLSERRLVIEHQFGKNGKRRFEITSEGCVILNRLVTARRESLSEVYQDWSPEKRVEIADALQRIARQLVQEVPSKPS
jgi:DNA-binding MarR family transcriptional regulator